MGWPYSSTGHTRLLCSAIKVSSRYSKVLPIIPCVQFVLDVMLATWSLKDSWLSASTPTFFFAALTVNWCQDLSDAFIVC